MKIRSEASVKRAIQHALKAMGVICFRMNSGKMIIEHKGRRRMISMAPAGTADILAFVGPQPLWIEVKRPGGKLTREQEAFRFMVTDIGHNWICADGVEIVMAAIQGLRGKVN
jgi:hypothetical protein